MSYDIKSKKRDDVMKKLTVALCLLAALLTLFSCGKKETTKDQPSLSGSPSSENEAVLVEDIRPSLSKITLYEGEQTALSFEITPKEPDDPTVEISVADQTLLSFENGVLTALKAGESKVVFKSKDGNCQKEVEVTVLPYFAVEQIGCDKESLTLDMGDSLTPVFTVLPENATRPDLTFRSSDPEIFSVSKTGKIKALAVGQGSLTVSTADGVELVLPVTVVPHENHRLGEWEVAFPASCTELGMRIRYCEICGSEHYEYESIERLDHTYGEGEVITVATREENGLSRQTCSVCGDHKDTVLRVEEEMIADGVLGPDIEFAYYNGGELYVRGKGQFYTWSTERPNPLKELNGIKKVVIGQGVTLISDYSFDGLKSLTEVKLPDSLQMIGTRAFFGCEKMTLTRKELPASLQFVGGGAFSGCKNITALVFSDAFIGCGQSAFEGCSSLAELTLSSAVQSLGSRAFADCVMLQTVLLPSDAPLALLSSELFKGCKALKEITLPEGVTTVDTAAFGECSSLEKVFFGSRLEIVGKDAFAGCTALKEAHYPKNEEYFAAHVALENGNDPLKKCWRFAD